MKLTMQAFGSYGKKKEIDFTKPNQNLFLISGDTGSGKTTIFDAIVFALYGEASSENNKKDGAELQSQFVGYEISPFVELTFSERNGDDTDIYTVHRVPRHIRPLQRGTGVKEEKENVSLILPDGLEYAQNTKETNRKLEEIVGLTKGQFMQVAMIAQGEFMELLRAKSDDKKVIFRKLFHTELFQDVVEELAARRREKSAEIARIKTACQTEVGHIVIPEEDQEAEELQRIKKRILSAEKLSVSDMEALLVKLEQLCDRSGVQRKQAQEECEKAGKARDEARDALSGAKNLLGFFRQLEQAQKDLAECEALEETRKASEKKMIQMEAAYEIEAVYQRFADQEKAVSSASEKMKRLQQELPGLETEDRKAAQEAAAALEKQSWEVENFTRVSEQATKARETFIQKKTEQEKIFTEAILAADTAEKEAASAQKKAEKARENYQKARDAYGKANGEYTEKQMMFLDAQAGFLAKEQLRAGEPCPVCGSLEHPHPRELAQEHRELTRELIEELKSQAEELAKKQEKASAASAAAAEAVLSSEKNRTEALEKLRSRLAEQLSDIPAELSLKQAEMLFDDWKKEIADKELLLKKKTDAALDEAQKSRQSAEHVYSTAQEKARKAKAAREQAQALIDRYQEELPGMTKERDLRNRSYQKICGEKNLSESEWKTITKTYQKEEIDQLREEINAYDQKKASASRMQEAAEKAIGDQKRPEMEELQAEMEAAQHKLDEVQKLLERCKEEYKANQYAYDSLAPKMEERSRVTQEYTRIDSLYNRFAGKVTGARMDIETYVQRYYLERILDAANIRFQEMSAGQFELRMYDIEKAGEGKNRGLDLMVYSTVTGKEREVRTLSGGESFMAALSLSLGMADQIQESSASINLDVMFIDEGFGSLDEHSRNQAVRVLQQMAGGSRLIGIISHVTELKQEIDDQLLVTKDENGSDIHWQIS
jgi:exonuclease SbcC